MARWTSDALIEALGTPSSGKVRDRYSLSKRGSKALDLAYVSDRASIFDFKLGFEVPGKGAILNAFNIAARLHRRSTYPALEDDMAAFGTAIDEYLPAALHCRKHLQKRATVVERLEMIPYECVVRGWATGSLYKAHAAGARDYCGHTLPDILRNGEKLDAPLFTPTTKAPVGQHDEPLDHKEVAREQIDLMFYALVDYQCLAEHSLAHGIVPVDSKAEYGRRRRAGEMSRPILADEFWTPDSCRFWSLAEYEERFPKALPDALDKQALRNWGISMGIDKLDPGNPEHREEVWHMRPPESVIGTYLDAMHQAFEMLWGKTVAEFRRDEMGIISNERS